VVGHLYRRVQQPVTISEGGQSWTLDAGDLVDLCIRPANADPDVVGDSPLELCPGRTLPAGVNQAVLSFGDGAHKCPGQPLAILESDVLLRRLLALDVTVVAEPELGWDDLIAGYFLRGFDLALAGRKPSTSPDQTLK
jgi:cytochrome P450